MSREDMRRIIDSTYSADSIKEVNFLRKNPPSEYEAIMYEKMRTIKSYAQFARRYFTSGSTKDQVRKVQGYPEDVVDVGNLTEVWFYGNCEVTIYNGLVQKVENQTNCINYIDLKVCLISPERRVSSNMQTVIEERTNAYNSTH
ncbi:MAG: hypothetical protein ABIN01_13980 [Ferruginibacter sp.]